MNKRVDEVTKEQLTADFKTLVADAEALLKATANQRGEELAAIRARAKESLRTVKTRIADEQVELLHKTKEAARATDGYIHENTWKAVGVAAGVGLVIGMLSRRR